MAFDKSGHEVVVLAVKGSFDLPETDGGESTLSPVQEPLFLADVFGHDAEKDAPVFENDFAPFKPKCDVLCHGSAVAPGERLTTTVNVGIRVGNWAKAFSVHGSRIWIRTGLGHRISDPRPFVRLPISYDSAWGGTDPATNDPTHAATWEENPAGVGYYPNRRKLEAAPLPATAELNRIVNDITGPHRPMAFGPLGRSWLPRRSYAGTYDEAWLADRMPFLPDDFDDRYHQAAPPDQQIAYPKGGEPVELVGLTGEGRLRTFLPRDQVVVTFHCKNGRFTQKIANLDTVLILTEARKICLTWRSRFVTDRDIHELQEIIVRRETAGVSA